MSALQSNSPPQTFSRLFRPWDTAQQKQQTEEPPATEQQTEEYQTIKQIEEQPAKEFVTEKAPEDKLASSSNLSNVRVKNEFNENQFELEERPLEASGPSCTLDNPETSGVIKSDNAEVPEVCMRLNNALQPLQENHNFNGFEVARREVELNNSSSDSSDMDWCSTVTSSTSGYSDSMCDDEEHINASLRQQQPFPMPYMQPNQSSGIPQMFPSATVLPNSASYQLLPESRIDNRQFAEYPQQFRLPNCQVLNSTQIVPATQSYLHPQSHAIPQLYNPGMATSRAFVPPYPVFMQSSPSYFYPTAVTAAATPIVTSSELHRPPVIRPMVQPVMPPSISFATSSGAPQPCQGFTKPTFSASGTVVPVAPTFSDPYLAKLMEEEYNRIMNEVAQIRAANARKQRPKKFKCPHCEVAFSNNGQLRGHIRIHTGERPFKCDDKNCGKTFTRNEELTRHKRIHSGIRPFSCIVCGKSFGRRDHLKKHMKTHYPHDPLVLPMYLYKY